MQAYLTHDDPAAYEGLPKLQPNLQYGFVHECPKCKGHGGWILRKDAYGAGEHFMAGCADCGGFGYTHDPVTCVHDWSERETIGRCLHTWTCSKCGAQQTVDSSD